MTIVELREKRAKLWATMEGFLDTHRNDKGVLSTEDDAVYANMEKELNDLTNEVRRMERRDAIAAELAKPVSAPITEQPQKATAEAKTGRASNAYREDFGLHLRGKRMLHNVLSEGVDANGGYLVPTEFEKFIVDTLKEENVMRRLCKVITTDNERKIPVAATHSTAAWTAENAAYTESNPTFAQKTIDAYKLTDLVKVSIELLDDSAFDLEEYIAREFAYAFGAAEEQAFCVGTGTGQPTGLFTANGGTVGVTAASATAVTTDEVISLIYALKAPYRKNAKFLMNDATVSALRKLKDSNGQYLWQPALHEGGYDTLLGKRIYTSPYAPELAAGKKTVAFGDFNYYWIGDRLGITFKRLNERFAETGQIGFIASKRLDGKLILPEAIKVLQQKGSASSGG